MQIDQVRAYWDAQPCNVRHSDKPVGTWEWSEEVARRRYFVQPHIPGFAEFGRWDKVLEVGCGIGTDAIRFRQEGAEVTAVDASIESIRILQQRIEASDLYRIFTYKCDIDHLNKGLNIGTYDLIYCFGVLHHTPHPEWAVAQIRKFAGSGTIFKVMVYHCWSWKALRIWLGYDQPEAQAGCPIARTYSRRAARKLIEAWGFRVTEMRVEHIFPYSIPEYVRHEYKKVWYFRWMPRPLFRLLERTIGWHLLITAEVK